MKFFPNAHKIEIEVIVVAGHTRSGKAIMLDTISSFKKFEKYNMDTSIEEAGSLYFVKKIDKLSAKYLIRKSMLHKLYNSSIGREVNFRKNDRTSIFSCKNPREYLKRLNKKEGDKTFSKFLNKKPRYPVMIHYGLLYSDLLFESFPRLKIIQMEKNPFEIAYSWIKKRYEGGFEKNLRSTLLRLNFRNKLVPFYAYKNAKEYLSLNKYDRVVLVLDILDKIKKIKLKKLNSLQKKNYLEINHLDFVTNTDEVLGKLKKFLNAEKTEFTKKILKKNKCPRVNNVDQLKRKKLFLERKLSKKYFKILEALEKKSKIKKIKK